MLVRDRTAISLLADACQNDASDEARSKQAADVLAAIRESYDYEGDLDAFASTLCERLAQEGAPSLGKLHTSDLFLSWAICQGLPGFAEILLQRYHSDLLAALRKIGLSATEVEEARQTLTEKVLVAANGKEPAIRGYAGRGPLGAWLRTAAVRTGLSIARSRKTHEKADALDLLPATEADPELQLLKEKYRAEFSSALKEALLELGVRERNLLRQHYLDGLSSSELASLYKVHKATAARWVVAARDALADSAKQLLRGRLNVSPTELESIARLVRSDLHVSIGRLLMRSGSQ